MYENILEYHFFMTNGKSHRSNNSHAPLRTRLQLILKMLNVICQERLLEFKQKQHLQNNISRIEKFLREESNLTTDELENLLEHCKLYINTYLCNAAG